jgi:hypothetical protein
MIQSKKIGEYPGEASFACRQLIQGGEYERKRAKEASMTKGERV